MPEMLRRGHLHWEKRQAQLAKLKAPGKGGRSDKPAASGKRRWEHPLAALPAIADFTRLFNFSNHEGTDMEVHRNGAGQFIIDESFCQQPVGKRTGLYANVRQRRFITAEALCDLVQTLLTPKDYEAIGPSICKHPAAMFRGKKVTTRRQLLKEVPGELRQVALAIWDELSRGAKSRAELWAAGDKMEIRIIMDPEPQAAIRLGERAP
jgi:hypothetical protein